MLDVVDADAETEPESDDGEEEPASGQTLNPGTEEPVPLLAPSATESEQDLTLAPGTEEASLLPEWARPGSSQRAVDLREQIVDLQARMLRWFRSMQNSLRREHAKDVAALLDGWPDDAALAAMPEDALRSEWERRYDQKRYSRRTLFLHLIMTSE